MKTVKIDGQTFTLINDKLKVQRLTVKNDELVLEWHIACMPNGCKLTTLAKAYRELIK